MKELALMLAPFDQNIPDWIKSARPKMEQIYMDFLQIRSNEDNNRIFNYTIRNGWLVFGDLNQIQTELNEYLNASVLRLRETEIDTFNPITWYEANKGSYPTLDIIACNIFAIPAMSTEAERVFNR